MLMTDVLCYLFIFFFIETIAKDTKAYKKPSLQKSH